MEPPVALVSAPSTTPPSNLTPTIVVPVFLCEVGSITCFSRRSSFLRSDGWVPLSEREIKPSHLLRVWLKMSHFKNILNYIISIIITILISYSIPISFHHTASWSYPISYFWILLYWEAKNNNSFSISNNDSFSCFLESRLNFFRKFALFMRIYAVYWSTSII